jgi:type I restriction enzyme S subunit
MHKYLRAANVGWDGLILDDVKLMNFTDVEMSLFRLEPGDLLLNEASGSPREVGKPAIWRGEIENCAFQNTLLRVRPKPVVDPRYLLHFFQHEAATGAFARGARGVGIHHLGRDALARWPVPLPPLHEQRRIAAILDQADALRVKRRQVLTYFHTVLEAIFVDVFGDELAKANTSLGEIALVSSGLTKGRRTSEPTQLVPYLAVVNVQAGHLNLEAVKHIEATDSEIKRYALSDGDLLLTEGGDPDKLGRGTVWRNELPLCLHQNHIFRVRTHPGVDLDSDYLSAYMASRPARSYFLRAAKQTTGIASINMTQLKALPVLVPSTRRQQEYLGRVRAATSPTKKALLSAIVLDQLFDSLQSRAYSGQL